MQVMPREYLLQLLDPKNQEEELPSGKSFSCSICNKCFNLKSGLKEHFDRKVQIFRYSCSKCESQPPVFYNKCTLWQHAQEHDQVPLNYDLITVAPLPQSLISAERFSSYPKVAITCEGCKLEFYSRSSLERHLNQGRFPYPCPLCQLPCPSFCSLNIHNTIHSKNGSFTCPECGIGSFKDFQTFQYHCELRCFHVYRKLLYCCEKCDRGFADRQGLQKHLSTKHLDIKYICSEPPTQPLESGKKEIKKENSSSYTMSFPCPLCPSQLGSLFYFLSHIKEHLTLSKLIKRIGFQCKACKQIFESNSTFRQHLISAHKYLSCKFCQNIFKTSSMLSCHQDRCIAVNCQSCTTDVLRGEDLVSHGRQHLEDNMWVCLFCNNRMLNSRLELLSHLQLHTQVVYPHTCRHCCHNYSNGQQLLLHLLLLHLCLVLTCDTCGEKFDSSQNLESHLLTMEHAVQVYSCLKCSMFSGPYLQDMLMHVIEKHQIYEQQAMKASFRAKWFGFTERAMAPVTVTFTKDTFHNPPVQPDSRHLLFNQVVRTEASVSAEPGTSTMPTPGQAQLMNVLSLAQNTYCAQCNHSFISPEQHIMHQNANDLIPH